MLVLVPPVLGLVPPRDGAGASIRKGRGTISPL